MTQREIETELYEVKARIMDTFKDIQSNANALKTPDDRARIRPIFTKIKDYMDDVNRWLDEMDRLEMETPEEENQDNSEDDYF